MEYPKVSDLQVYGIDVPLPESEEDLVCEYRWHEGSEELGIPPVTFRDLEGYRVPPDGVYVTRAGGGKRDGTHQYVYPPGTFFENRVTMNKPMGVTHDELMAIREEKAKEAQVNAVIAFLEYKLGDDLNFTDANKFRNEVAVEGLVLWALKMIDEKGAAREARSFVEWYVKQQQKKEEVISRHREKAGSMTPQEAREWFDLYKEAQSVVTFDVIEGEYEEGEP